MKNFIFFFLLLAATSGFSQVTTISQTSLGSYWYSGVDDWGGESFTILNAGYLTEIRFQTQSPEGVTTFEIREGQSTTGTLLYTTTINISATGWFIVPLPNIPVCEGVYCFLVSGFQWGSLDNTNPYTGGQALYSGFWSSTLDMAFEVDQIINNEPTSPTSFSNYTVCSGDVIPLTSFTITDENPSTVIVSANSSNTSVIPNGNIVLGGSGSSRTISFSSPSSIAGTTTITLTVDDGNCTNNYSFNVTVNALPTVSAGADITDCQGASVTLSGSGSATAYTWDNSVIDGTAFTPGIGTITYTVTGVDGNGCVNTDVVNVTINALPTVTFNALSPLCTNETPYTLVEGVPGGGTYSGTAVSSGSFDPAVSGPGSFVLNYSYTDGNGCTNSANQTMTVNAYTPASFNVLADLCANDTLYQLTEGTPPGGVYSGPGISGNNFDPGAASIGPNTLYYTYTDGNGCVDMVNQNINVLDFPIVTGSSDVTICEGDSATISVTGSALTYTWDWGLGSGTSQIVSPTFNTLYQVTGTGANGCTNKDSVIVWFNALPNVTMSTIGDICANSAPYTLTEGSPGGGTYFGTGVSGSTFDPSIGTGTYMIHYTYTDGTTGCTNEDSTTIVVYSAPTVIATSTGTSICDGGAVTLTGSGALTYLWDNGVTDGVGFTPSVGTVTYTVTGSDANGCQGTDQIDVTVNPLPLVVAGPDQTVCEGTAVTLNAFGASTYSWDNGANNGVPFNPAVGTFTYTVIGTDANGCENTDALMVTVNPSPVLVVSADQDFCLGDTIVLSASGATSYDWDGGSSSIDTYVISPTSSVAIQVIGTSLACSSAETINLTMDDPSNVDAGADQEICEGFSTNLSASGGTDYIWNGPDANDINSQDIYIQVDSSGYYYVDVTTALGCVYTDSVYISVSTDPNCSIETLTTITPNGDAVNDFWKIQGIEGFPDNHVTIFNRWGDKVFEEDNYDNDLVKWEGTTLNGGNAAPGTYFYLIEITNGPTTTGWIQLMK